MERLILRYNEALKALKTLEDILNEPFSVIIRDATIQRFGYCFEISWKFLKEYLKEKHGIICNSPKSCFREAFSVGILLNEEETMRFLEMADDRNLTTHTYKEEVAQNLYEKIKGHCKLLKELIIEKCKID